MRKISSIVILMIVGSLLVFTLVDTNLFAPVQSSKQAIAPEVTIQDGNGAFQHIGGPSSKVILLHFWASWCGPCEEEAPSYVKLFEKYGDKITFIGVNATNVDKEADAQAFVRKHGWKFKILFDKKGVASESYQLIGYPTTVIVDRKGNIVENLSGQQTFSKLEQVIQSHIK